jgi:hypothetical protein
LREQESDPVGVNVVAAPKEGPGEIIDAPCGEAVAVSEDSEFGETVGLPIARVVVSADVVSTPLMSVAIMVLPSVTVVSGTPTSGAGVGDGLGDGVGDGKGWGFWAAK